MPILKYLGLVLRSSGRFDGNGWRDNRSPPRMGQELQLVAYVTSQHQGRAASNPDPEAAMLELTCHRS